MATIAEALKLAWQTHQAGDVQKAEQVYRRVLDANPNSALAWCYLGIACHDLGRWPQAVEAYGQALRLQPSFPVAYNNLANTLIAQNKPEEAADCCRRALQLKPDYANAHNNLGAALARQGRFDEAAASFREAIRLDPQSADAHNNLGAALHGLGRLDEALASFQDALNIRPDYAEAHKNRAVVRLLSGDFEQGWVEFEWRWKCPQLAMPPYRQPVWDGSPLTGKTILLHAEQGLGDTIQFVRYAPMVKQYGGHVVVAAQPPLVRMLGSCSGIDALASRDAALPPFDCHAPLMSLPRILGFSLDTIPANVPYLAADDLLVAQWRRELDRRPSFKIGIAWQGSSIHPLDRHRSVALEHFAPLARLEGVELCSLQKGRGVEQLISLGERFSVTDFGPRLDEKAGPFMDTAAIMKNLDLVIAADTAVAHLAGALAVPVWLALSFTPDWRWLLERQDSPWYPTMRLFRQRRPGDWTGVFESMAAALRERLSAAPLRPAGSSAPSEAPGIGKSTARKKLEGPIAVEISPGELIDKITILEIKAELMTDPEKRNNVRAELKRLEAARDRAIKPLAELAELTDQLRAVNRRLWRIEDEIRCCERDKRFGPDFVELARSIYRSNDERAALKRRIDQVLGSGFTEEKSCAEYDERRSD